MFSSKGVTDSIANTIEIYFKVYDYAEKSPEEININQINAILDSITIASLIVIKNVRRELGTEPLSEETLKMFGETPKKLKVVIERE